MTRKLTPPNSSPVRHGRVHRLHHQRPLGVVAASDGVVEVLRRVRVVGAADLDGLVLEQALDAWLGWFQWCVCVVGW